VRGYSERYPDAALRGGHLATRIDVLGEELTLTSTTTLGVKVSGGSVSVDRAQLQRRTLVLELFDKTGAFVPNNGSDLFSTLSGHEIAAFVGYRYPDGSEDLFSQGVFGLSDDDPVDEGSRFSMTIRGADRMRAVARNAFTRPWVVTNGANGVDAVVALIIDRRPGTEFRIVPTSLTVPRMVFEEKTNPAEAVSKLAGSFGYEVFFDADGLCVVQPEPDPSVLDPVWDYTEGDRCSLTKMARPSSNEKAFNGLILVGESTYGITPARAEVWDSDPSSPTYYLGPYGKVPDFQTDTLISTQAQVNAAAAARFRKSLGAAETVSMSMVPNPAHEEGDVIQVARERLRLDAKLVLDSFSVPFTAGEMTARCRERRVL
jgi:hypothetical protein